jgi:hypothetical protein
MDPPLATTRRVGVWHRASRRGDLRPRQLRDDDVVMAGHGAAGRRDRLATVGMLLVAV